MATLINGNGNLAIYAQQDADWYASIMGDQTVITGVGQQFKYSLLDANTIGVSDGVIITKEGRRIQLDVNEIDTFDIPSGAQGTTNYYIIGYHLVTGDQSEQTVETFVQLMENGSDTIPEGSFREGDDDVFVSLYRVQQNDLALGTITLLLPKVDSLQSQIDGINANLSAKVGGKITNYTSIKNLAYDNTNNKIMLKVEGADTPIPFSKSSSKSTTISGQLIRGGGGYMNYILGVLYIGGQAVLCSGWVSTPSSSTTDKYYTVSSPFGAYNKRIQLRIYRYVNPVDYYLVQVLIDGTVVANSGQSYISNSGGVINTPNYTTTLEFTLS